MEPTAGGVASSPRPSVGDRDLVAVGCNPIGAVCLDPVDRGPATEVVGPAVAGAQQVTTSAPVHLVCALPARGRVPATIADQAVGTETADEAIGSAVPVELVGPLAADQDVRPLGAEQVLDVGHDVVLRGRRIGV